MYELWYVTLHVSKGYSLDIKCIEADVVRLLLMIYINMYSHTLCRRNPPDVNLICYIYSYECCHSVYHSREKRDINFRFSFQTVLM